MARHVAILGVALVAEVLCAWFLLACFNVVPMPPTWLAWPAGTVMGVSLVALPEMINR